MAEAGVTSSERVSGLSADASCPLFVACLSSLLLLLLFLCVFVSA
jgi:hypothetical protein